MLTNTLFWNYNYINNTYLEVYMKTAAKVLLIIGMVLTSLSQLWVTVCLLFVYFIGILYAPVALILTALAIVFGVISYKKLNQATCRAEFPTVWGVLSIIFVSLPAGIIMLCMKDENFIN